MITKTNAEKLKSMTKKWLASKNDAGHFFCLLIEIFNTGNEYFLIFITINVFH